MNPRPAIVGEICYGTVDLPARSLRGRFLAGPWEWRVSDSSTRFEYISAIAMELIPVAIQAASIVVFLILTRQDHFQAFAAVILSSVWLKVSESRMPEDFGNFRLTRYLFALIGNWMNRDEAAKEFDDALARYTQIDGIENDLYMAVVTAAGLANSLRGFVSFSVFVYLTYLVATVLLIWQ